MRLLAFVERGETAPFVFFQHVHIALVAASFLDRARHHERVRAQTANRVVKSFLGSFGLFKTLERAVFGLVLSFNLLH